MLYQMLTGDRPFTGSPSTIMQKVLRQDPVEPSVLNPTLSASWDTLIKRALAKKPDDRLQSARQFSESMRLVFEGKPLPFAPELSADATVRIDATLRIAPPRAQRRKLPLIALGSAAVVAMAAGGIGYYRSGATPPPDPLAQASAVAPEAPPAAKPAPRPKRVEKKAAKAAPPPAPVAEAKVPPAPAPVVAKVEPAPAAPAAARAGKVVSLDRNWGFLVVESTDPGMVKVGDRLYANLGSGRRVPIVVRRISGNLVSAVAEGQKISDDMLGASVTAK
jgi:serine/threonine-protein kinase